MIFRSLKIFTAISLDCQRYYGITYTVSDNTVIQYHLMLHKLCITAVIIVALSPSIFHASQRMFPLDWKLLLLDHQP